MRLKLSKEAVKELEHFYRCDTGKIAKNNKKDFKRYSVKLIENLHNIAW